jgi:hypothetical protein
MTYINHCCKRGCRRAGIGVLLLATSQHHRQYLAFSRNPVNIYYLKEKD